VSSFNGSGIDLVRKFMGILPKSIVRTENIALQASIDEESKK
jgi:GTPase